VKSEDILRNLGDVDYTPEPPSKKKSRIPATPALQMPADATRVRTAPVAPTPEQMLAQVRANKQANPDRIRPGRPLPVQEGRPTTLVTDDDTPATALRAAGKVFDFTVGTTPMDWALNMLPIGQLLKGGRRVRAAFKLGDKIFESGLGKMHPDAARKLKQAGGSVRDAVDGFTIDGTFYPRNEASKVLQRPARSEELFDQFGNPLPAPTGTPSIERNIQELVEQVPPVNDLEARIARRAEKIAAEDPNAAAIAKVKADYNAPSTITGDTYDQATDELSRRRAAKEPPVVTMGNVNQQSATLPQTERRISGVAARMPDGTIIRASNHGALSDKMAKAIEEASGEKLLVPSPVGGWVGNPKYVEYAKRVEEGWVSGDEFIPDAKLKDWLAEPLPAGAPPHSEFVVGREVVKPNPFDTNAADLLAGKNGFTLDPRTGKDMMGSGKHAVATNLQQKFDHPPTPAEVAAFRAEHAELLKNPNVYSGGWYDEEAKTWELNITELYDDKDEALRIAGERGEKAIGVLGDEYSEIKVPKMPEPKVEAPAINKGARPPVEEGLLPHELKQFERNAETIRKHFALMPTPDEFSDLILLGAHQRGWYDTVTKAIHESFGDEAPRFAALLAATSPQAAVDRNLENALTIWRDWKKAGSPTDVEAIRKLIPATVVGGKNNVPTALTASMETLLDPKVLAEGGLLSGPKVDPFYSNMMGSVQRVVNDTHMATAYGTNGDLIAKVGRWMPGTSLVRQASRLAGEKAGVTITPREGQEMSWSAIKAIKDLLAADPLTRSRMVRKQGASHLDVLGDIEGLTKLTETTPGFGTLMSQEPYASLLRQIPGVQAPSQMSPGGVPGLDRTLIKSGSLAEVAKRLDLVAKGMPLFGLGGLMLAAPEDPRRN
jgi:hypothetical protein